MPKESPLSMAYSSKPILPELPKLSLAVVGHVEWMTFLSVDKLPEAGLISHSIKEIQAPAGGGAVIAVKLAELTGEPVDFFTALGNDELGHRSLLKLNELGVRSRVAWKDKATRRGISFADSKGDRAITVIGERLQPSYKDNLDWNDLKDYDGVFITAGDHIILQHCRKAKVLGGTPRIGMDVIKHANIKLDLLISSKLDPAEKIGKIGESINPLFRIETEGELGGEVFPGGKYSAYKVNKKKIIDTYGCGDSFAAGVTAGLSAQLNIEEAVTIGAYLGAICSTRFGPY